MSRLLVGDWKLATTHLRRLLERGEFTVTGEVGPPRGTNHELLLDRIRTAQSHCDAINITDNVRGIPTMSSMVCSSFVLQSGNEPIMQLSSRDRNRVAIASDLYGAYALGVRNLLFITGDHTLLGSHPHTKMVYDLDSIQALQIASHLMTGTDLADDDLEGTPSFYLGATFNPRADPLEMQVMRVEKKHEAGAQFFQTQAIYDMARFEEFLEQLGGVDIKILAGIIPLKSPTMARFMNKCIPGIKIPEELIERLERAGAGKNSVAEITAFQQEGLAIAIETVKKVRDLDGVNGVHIMGIGWEESIPQIVEATNLYPRPRKE